eukprot:9908356-Alexandrium_andersonii.AAC.1
MHEARAAVVACECLSKGMDTSVVVPLQRLADVLMVWQRMARFIRARRRMDEECKREREERKGVLLD